MLIIFDPVAVLCIQEVLHSFFLFVQFIYCTFRSGLSRPSIIILQDFFLMDELSFQYRNINLCPKKICSGVMVNDGIFYIFEIVKFFVELPSLNGLHELKYLDVT